MVPYWKLKLLKLLPIEYTAEIEKKDVFCEVFFDKSLTPLFLAASSSGRRGGSARNRRKDRSMGVQLTWRRPRIARDITNATIDPANRLDLPERCFRPTFRIAMIVLNNASATSTIWALIWPIMMPARR
jgi:hypothetical protein